MARPKPVEVLLGKAHARKTQERWERMNRPLQLWASFVSISNSLRELDREEGFRVVELLKSANFYRHDLDAKLKRKVTGEGESDVAQG